MPPFIRTLLQTVVGLIVIGAIWFAAALVIDNALSLPGPLAVFTKIADLVKSAEYMRHASESLTALLFGFVPAVAAGLLIGLVARAGAMRWIAGPITTVIAAAPILALYPLFVAWGGLSIAPKATLIFIAAAFPIMNAVMMHASRPPAAPGNEAPPPRPHGTAISVLSGLRLGVILAVAALILSEFSGASRGAAYLIMSSSAMLDTTTMLAAFLLIALPTVFVVTILQAIEEQVAG